MFIKIKADAVDDYNIDEALINTNQISWININDRSIRFADGSFLYVSNSELNKVIMATTEQFIYKCGQKIRRRNKYDISG